MDTIKKSVMVALLPQDDSWCKIEPAHMTLVYVGETDKLPKTAFNNLAKDVASIAMLSNPVMVKVIGTDVFGVEEKVDVFRLAATPEILSMRNMLEEWDTEEFPVFNPHVTIGPVGSWSPDWNSQSTPMPMYLIFDRIMVGWGEDRLVLWLRKY